MSNVSISQAIQWRIQNYRYRKSFPYSPASDRLRAIFIHIPKSAGTSVRIAMGEPSTGRWHIPWWVYRKANRKKFENYYKFAFVRHPLGRAVSAFNYLCEGGNQLEDLAIAQKIQAYVSFEEFIEKELARGFMMQHPLFRPQSDYVADFQGNLQVDFIGKFENLNSDFEKVAKTLNLPESLARTNSSRPNHNNVTITASAQAAIERLYHNDYLLFDYD